MKRYIFMLALGIFCTAGFEQAAAAPGDLRFNALSGEGRGQSQPATLGTLGGSMALVTFWRADCAPCVRELTILPKIAVAHPGMQIVVVSLQDATHTRSYFTGNFPETIHVWIALDDSEMVFSAFDHKEPSLPFSVMLRKDGSLCDHHDGMLGTDIVDGWARTC